MEVLTLILSLSVGFSLGILVLFILLLRFTLKHGVRMWMEWRVFRLDLLHREPDTMKAIEWPDIWSEQKSPSVPKERPEIDEVPRDPLERYRMARELEGRPLGAEEIRD